MMKSITFAPEPLCSARYFFYFSTFLPFYLFLFFIIAYLLLLLLQVRVCLTSRPMFGTRDTGHFYGLPEPPNLPKPQTGNCHYSYSSYSSSSSSSSLNPRLFRSHLGLLLVTCHYPLWPLSRHRKIAGGQRINPRCTCQRRRGDSVDPISSSVETASGK